MWKKGRKGYVSLLMNEKTHMGLRNKKRCRFYRPFRHQPHRPYGVLSFVIIPRDNSGCVLQGHTAVSNCISCFQCGATVTNSKTVLL